MQAVLARFLMYSDPRFHFDLAIRMSLSTG